MEFHARDFQTGQHVSVHSPRVQAYLIIHHQGQVEWGMAEYDPFAEIILGKNKWFPDPKAILLGLFPDGNAWLETRVDDIIIIDLEHDLEGFYKGNVIYRDTYSTINPVTS